MSSADILRDALFGNPPMQSKEPSREGVLAAHTDLMLTTQAGIAAAALSGTDLTAAMALVAPLLASAEAAEASAASSVVSAAASEGSAEASAASSAQAADNAALATEEALRAASNVRLALEDFDADAAALINAAVVSATAQAEAARDAVRPLFGATTPASGVGQLGQSYYQKTAESLLFYGPKTEGGWGEPISLRGASSGPLGAGSVTADTITTNTAERAAIAELLPVLRQGGAFLSTFSTSALPVGVAPGLVYLESQRSDGHDMLYLSTRHLSGSGVYSLHIVDYAESGVTVGGSLGVAIDGPGGLSAGTFNKRGIGAGHGIIASRLETGNGSAIFCNWATTSAATGSALTALKQNADGSVTPGADCGIGPTLEIINKSNQGAAIESTTTANNAWALSNVFRRDNIASGLVVDVQTLMGGLRTAQYTSLRVLHTPQSASTGTASVQGFALELGPNITGSAETAGLVLVNNTTSTSEAFGALIQSIGVNTNNRALRLTAANGVNNIALEVTAGQSLFNGPLDTTSIYKVAGVQVIGARGAAVADATDATTAISQLNTLLMRVRNHGLIAA